MMIFRFFYFGVLSVFLLCLGCSVKKENAELGVSALEFRRALIDEESSRWGGRAEELPVSAEAHYAFIRGELALAEKDHKSALEFYEKAARVELAPAPLLRKRLAELFVRGGKLEEALLEVDKALTESAENVELLQLRGGILATLKRTDEAISTYRHIVELSPGENSEVYILLASLFAQSGNVSAAQGELEAFIQKNPQNAIGYYYLGRMYELEEKLQEAEKHYKKALRLNESSEQTAVDLARVIGRQKRSKEAVKVLEKLIRRRPGNLNARRLLSQLLLNSNEIDKALEQFEALGELEEDSTGTRFRMALIKFEKGDLDGAQTELSLILASRPDHAPSRYYLASIYARQDRLQDAIAEIKKIPPKRKIFVDSRVFAAYLLQQKKEFEQGISLLKDALAEKPEEVRFLTFLAMFQRQSGKLKDAVQSLQKLLRLEPEEAKHYFTLGVVYDELEWRGDAMRQMRKAIALNPKDANALNYLGYTLAETGKDLEEAEKLIKQALEIDKDNGYYIDSLGWVYYKQGRFKDALRELLRANTLVPDDAVILEHVAVVHMKLGQTNEAREVLKRALQHAPESDDEEVMERVEGLLEKLEGRP